MTNAPAALYRHVAGAAHPSWRILCLSVGEMDDHGDEVAQVPIVVDSRLHKPEAGHVSAISLITHQSALP